MPPFAVMIDEAKRAARELFLAKGQLKPRFVLETPLDRVEIESEWPDGPAKLAVVGHVRDLALEMRAQRVTVIVEAWTSTKREGAPKDDPQRSECLWMSTQSRVPGEPPEQAWMAVISRAGGSVSLAEFVLIEVRESIFESLVGGRVLQ